MPPSELNSIELSGNYRVIQEEISVTVLVILRQKITETGVIHAFESSLLTHSLRGVESFLRS